MLEKYLIVVDLDGTLLTGEHEITLKTKKTLQYLKRIGHELMIATGRPFRSSIHYYQELGMRTPIINFNGAFVTHPNNPNFNQIHHTINLQVVKDIIESLQEFTIFNIIAEVKDDVYFHYHDEKLISLFQRGNPKMTIGDINTFLEREPTALMIQTEEQYVPLIQEHLSNVHTEVIDHRSWSTPYHVVEMIKKGINKGMAVEQMANYLNIPMSNVITFGDEDNDFEMIRDAGTGVAMGNAIGKIKDIADFVTLSNEESGIAEFLIKKFNIPEAVWEA